MTAQTRLALKNKPKITVCGISSIFLLWRSDVVSDVVSSVVQVEVAGEHHWLGSS